MAEMSTYLGFDIMGTLVFGCDFQSVQGGERELANSVLPASMLMYWISYLPTACLVRPLLRTKLFEKLGGKPVTDNNRLIEYASSQVHGRSADLEQKRDNQIYFLSRLVGTEDKKTEWRPTLADLSTESLNLMNAGADPFSSILAAAFFYLLHNPDTLAKATHEVRLVFPSSLLIITGSKLNTCTYLYACIEETLRLATLVPSYLLRVVLLGGMQIDADYLPAGIVVGVPMYAIHHSPSYFPAPFTFDPERWIESPPNLVKRIASARMAFNLFSIGARACSGRNLAYMQLKLTLAHLLRRFEFRLAEGEEGRGGGNGKMGMGREREGEY